MRRGYLADCPVTRLNLPDPSPICDPARHTKHVWLRRNVQVVTSFAIENKGFTGVCPGQDSAAPNRRETSSTERCLPIAGCVHIPTHDSAPVSIVAIWVREFWRGSGLG